jgi:hypothetical protein
MDEKRRESLWVAYRGLSARARAKLAWKAYARAKEIPACEMSISLLDALVPISGALAAAILVAMLVLCVYGMGLMDFDGSNPWVGLFFATALMHGAMLLSGVLAVLADSRRHWPKGSGARGLWIWSSVLGRAALKAPRSIARAAAKAHREVIWAAMSERDGAFELAEREDVSRVVDAACARKPGGAPRL